MHKVKLFQVGVIWAQTERSDQVCKLMQAWLCCALIGGIWTRFYLRAVTWYHQTGINSHQNEVWLDNAPDNVWLKCKNRKTTSGVGMGRRWGGGCGGGAGGRGGRGLLYHIYGASAYQSIILSKHRAVRNIQVLSNKSPRSAGGVRRLICVACIC